MEQSSPWHKQSWPVRSKWPPQFLLRPQSATVLGCSHVVHAVCAQNIGWARQSSKCSQPPPSFFGHVGVCDRAQQPPVADQSRSQLIKTWSAKSGRDTKTLHEARVYHFIEVNVPEWMKLFVRYEGCLQFWSFFLLSSKVQKVDTQSSPCCEQDSENCGPGLTFFQPPRIKSLTNNLDRRCINLCIADCVNCLCSRSTIDNRRIATYRKLHKVSSRVPNKKVTSKKKKQKTAEAQWPIGYGVGLRIKRYSVRIRPWPLRWVLAIGQGSLLPLSQGEAFTLASISYLAILVKYILEKKIEAKRKKPSPFAKSWLILRKTPVQSAACDCCCAHAMAHLFALPKSVTAIKRHIASDRNPVLPSKPVCPSIAQYLRLLPTLLSISQFPSLFLLLSDKCVFYITSINKSTSINTAWLVKLVKLLVSCIKNAKAEQKKK